MDGEIVIYAGALVGVLARIVLPWLMIWLRDGEKWNWRMAAGQLVSSAAAFIALLAANPDLPSFTWQEALAVGLASAAGGWGVADMGRTAQKSREP